jgi:hypothetical protein
MTITPIAIGSLNWGTPLNSILVQLDTNTSSVLSSSLQAANNLSDLTNVPAARTNLGITAGSVVGGNNFNVKDYGALGNGVQDDTSFITAAFTAASAVPGSSVFMPPGTYSISSPLIIPPQVRLQGTHSSHIDTTTCSIKPTAGFTGAAVLLMVDQTTGGYSLPSNQQSIMNITLDCSLLTGNTIDGIQTQGFVHGIIVEDVQIRNAPNHGVAFVSNGSGISYSHRFTRVAVYTSGSHGFSPAITDCTWIDCEAIGVGGNGFNFSGSAANSHFIGCRAEFAGGSGYSFNGSWGTGNGSGGMTFTGCSTDRSVNNGLSISATGTVPLIFTGMMLRRDGSNGTGNSINVNGATIPVTINGVAIHPGTNDDGSGTASPVTAVSVTNATYVNIATGWIHGITNTITNGGGNTAFRIGPNVGLATGTTASPTYNNNNPWGTDSGSTFTAGLVANDQTGIKVTQASTFTNLNNGLVELTSGNSGLDYIIKSRVSGDTNSRFGLNTSGQLNLGPGNATFDTNLYRSAATVLTTDNNLSVGGNALGLVKPTAHSMIAWTYDPAHCIAGKAGTAQTMYLAAIYVNRSTTATKLYWGINTAGATITAGQNFVGLYNSAGTQLASVGVDARVTTTGPFTETISAAVTPGLYWVAFLFNATTMPQVYRAQDLNGAFMNLGISSAANYRFATNGTGLSALPSTITPSSNATAQFSYWAAIG